MLYLTIGFLLFSLFLSYRNLRHASTWFLQGVIVGWIVSIIGLILYMSKQNYYFPIVSRVFPLGKGLWNWLIRTDIAVETVIRILNLGIVLFVFSIFSLCLVLLHREMRERIQKPAMTIVFLYSCIEYLAFYPSVQKSILYSGKTSVIIPAVFQWMNIGILLVSVILLLRSLIAYPKIRFLRNYTFYYSMMLIPIMGIFILLFSWLPALLLKRTLIQGYYVSVVPDLSENIILFQWLPYLMFLALTSILVAMFRFNAIDAYFKQRDIHINRSITTAGLGVKAFAHGVKNHLLSVRAEAELLQAAYSTTEPAYTTACRMIDSCNTALEAINNAAHRLREISLDLHPVGIDLPVRRAIEDFPAAHKIKLTIFGDIPRAFIDEPSLTETITNLLENAKEAADAENLRIVVEISSHETWGIITIKDNGPGITAEHLDTLFSPFFTTKSSIGNWGIGLSFCHRIVTAHGGKIEASNEPAGGAVFRILLPML
jgi:signal transduction histidine kinase